MALVTALLLCTACRRTHKLYMYVRFLILSFKLKILFKMHTL
jgi:hypothetical protein